MEVLFDWKKARGDAGEDECPNDLLERGDPGDLMKWLSLFVAEARTVKGSLQPFLSCWQGFLGICDQLI